MVKVIMGLKGTGKTKQMIDLINTAAEAEHGSVVTIVRGGKLTFDLTSKIRLVDTADYPMPNFDYLKGFICGLYASNFDITHIFVESLNKVVSTPDDGDPEIEVFLDWLESFSEKNGVKFTVSISADASLAHEGVKKYF